VMALSGALVLLATGRLHRRWPASLLCLGAVLAIATSESRTSVLGGVFALLAFALLSFSAGRRATRALIALLVAGTLAFALASILVPAAGKGVFDRYSSIAPRKAASTSVNYREGDLAQIPDDIKNDPFGQGLATTAAATGFGSMFSSSTRKPAIICGPSASTSPSPTCSICRTKSSHGSPTR